MRGRGTCEGEGYVFIALFHLLDVVGFCRQGVHSIRLVNPLLTESFLVKFEDTFFRLFSLARGLDGENLEKNFGSV